MKTSPPTSLTIRFESVEWTLPVRVTAGPSRRVTRGLYAPAPFLIDTGSSSWWQWAPSNARMEPPFEGVEAPWPTRGGARPWERPRIAVWLTACGLLFGAAVLPVRADINWDGDGTQGNFSWCENWYGNSCPSQPWQFSYGNLVFNYRNNGSQTSLYYDASSGWGNSISDIIWETTFGAGLPLNGAGNGINFNQRLENRSYYAQTVNIPLSGNKNGAGHIELNPVNGDMTLQQPVYNDSAVQYQVWGNNQKLLTVSADLVGGVSGKSGVSLNIEQASKVKFTAAQTWGGSSWIYVVGDAANAGELWIDSGGSLASGLQVQVGANPVDAKKAKFWLSGLSGGTSVGQAITVYNSGGTKVIGGLNTSGTNTFTGNITLNGPVNLLADPSGGTVEFKTGVIGGTSSVNINNTATSGGQVLLSGNNTYSGGTTVSAGTLRVNGQTGSNSGTGTGSVAVNAGGTLSGNSRIHGAVTVANSSTAVLYPNSGSTLTISNNLTFSGSSSGVKFDLSSSAAGANDKVVLVNNILTCGGAQITVNSAGTLSTNDYVLFDVGASGTISGSFNSVPAWSGTTPKYSAGYSIVTAGKTVVLRYTPIPVTVTAAANSKTYDGTATAAATPTVTSGSLGSGDTGYFSESYSTKHVGAGNKTLTPAGTVKDAGNNDVTAFYNITFAPITTGTISQTNLTVTATANTKTYDGTTSAAATPTITAGNIQTGDTAPTWTETYDTADVGTGKTLTPAGAVNDGNGGNNYHYTFAATANGTITAALTAGGFTSSANPSLPGANVTYTATVTNAVAGGPAPAGDVQFKTNGVPLGDPVPLDGSGVAALITNSLPHGSTTVVAEYAAAGNFQGLTNSLAQVVNTPPSAPDTDGGVRQNQALVINTTKLLSLANDPDGDALSITSAGPTSTNGGTVTLAGGNVTYQPVTDYLGADLFSFVVTDTYGGSATGTVQVAVVATNLPSPNVVVPPAYDSGSGTFSVTFAGIPNYTYSVQWAPSVIGPWSFLKTATAGSDGLLEVTDTETPPPPSRYYRTTYP